MTNADSNRPLRRRQIVRSPRGSARRMTRCQQKKKKEELSSPTDPDADPEMRGRGFKSIKKSY
jgi:hypothetical protein